jgi:RimJ/RimL family protein N-acetyltransferase
VATDTGLSWRNLAGISSGASAFFTLKSEYWGKGYAIEGARRALEYAFAELDREHVVSLIRPGNQGSINVAERLGEKLEGRTEVAGLDVLVYGIYRNEWRAA